MLRSPKHCRYCFELLKLCHFDRSEAEWRNLHFEAAPQGRNSYFVTVLISTSTPAGRSSFISAATVCCVGSRMSIRRLGVRISKASRDFLSTWGERRTQYLFFMVGSGMGPATWAPVRLAVSTISPVAGASTRCAY